MFIDLLGDGRVRVRGGDELLFDLDLTYKAQTEPGGIAQVCFGMARDFAAVSRWLFAPLTTFFDTFLGGRGRGVELGRADLREGGSEPPRTSAWSPTATTARSPTWSRKRGSSIPGTRSRPPNDVIVGLYCYPPDVFDVVAGLELSSRGELEITDVNRVYAAAAS